MDHKRYLIRRYQYCKTSLKENLEKEEIWLKDFGELIHMKNKRCEKGIIKDNKQES